MRSSRGHFCLSVLAVFALLGCGEDNLVGQKAGHGASSPGPAGSGAASSTAEALRISQSPLVTADLNRPYRAMFVAEGGTPDYAFELVDGALPGGMRLDASGQLVGTPSESGRFAFTAQVTDAAGNLASNAYVLIVSQHRWLEVETWFGVRPDLRLERGLIDLLDPDAPPLELGGGCISQGSKFSPDGRWFQYYSCPNGQEDPTNFLLPLDDPKPGAPHQLFEGSARSFVWAPDSSKIAFVKDGGNGTLDELTTLPADVFYFDTSQSDVGSEQTIASLPPVSPQGIVPATRQSNTIVLERAIGFLNANLLVMSHGPSDLARVDWQQSEPSPPVLLGLGSGDIVAQAPDGDRVLLAGALQSDGSRQMKCADLAQHRVTSLDVEGFVTMSSSFEVAFGNGGTGSGDTTKYYWVNGIQLQKVGERKERPLSFAKRSVLVAREDRLVLLTIAREGISEHEVPGDYHGLSDDSTQIANFLGENWIYFETNTGKEAHPDRLGSKEHWLSRLRVDGPSPAQIIDPDFDSHQGSNSRSDFSPDSEQIMLSDFESPPLYHWIKLSDPEHIEISELDRLGLKEWGVPAWSPDSTYLTIDATPYGDDPALVLDLLASPPTIRRLECPSDSALQHCSFPLSFQR